MSVKISEFGKLEDGRTVTAYTIFNKAGASCTFLNYGGYVQSVTVPDKNGKLTDVTLAYDSVAPYEENPNYFGAFIGRNANRIENGTFTLGGKTYTLPKNDAGFNNHHSGPDGFERRIFDVTCEEDGNEVRMELTSPDGDEGFPGNMKVCLTYTFSDDCALTYHISAVSDADTVANMTNHSYWNLNGHDQGSILDHTMIIHADEFTELGAHGIPTGKYVSVEGTPFDFREEKAVGRDIGKDDAQLVSAGGYDHNFVIRGSGMREATVLIGDVSGIVMTQITDQPGVQVYTGNYITGPNGKGGAVYGPKTGIALESQHVPNAINNPAFESVVLKAGEKYDTTTTYKFSVR